MKNRRTLIVIVVILVLIPVLLSVFMERVPPATIGVRQSLWGGGYESVDFSAGFHLGITGFHRWHFLPRQTHFLHFIEGSPAQQFEVDRFAPSLEVRNKDNNTVHIDVSVPYRIIPGMGHQILVRALKSKYQERVQSTVRSVLRSEFAKLSSEEIQSTDLRKERTQKVLPVLNEQLAQFFVTADSILIRRFSFPSEYEAKLQEKQYLRQKANLDQALTAQANEEKTVNLIERQTKAAELAKEQDWEKQLQEKRSEYEVKIATIRAEAEVYARRTRAEGEAERDILQANGTLALEQSEALRNQLRTEALNSRGGAILLGLEAAGNLQIPSVTLNSDDPQVPMILDLQSLTRMLVGEPGTESQAASGSP
ncbi:MAG: hypothetical protein DWQ01_13460 [Planctomycetota bacterium]|nr:MAG: hypothetical protein DWQ01_13460 [Planctomycetota bacterium]